MIDLRPLLARGRPQPALGTGAHGQSGRRPRKLCIETCLRERFPRPRPLPALGSQKEGPAAQRRSHKSARLHAPQIPATACFLFDTTLLPAPRRAKNGSRQLRPIRVAKRKPVIDKKCAAGSVSRRQGKPGRREQATPASKDRSPGAPARERGSKNAVFTGPLYSGYSLFTEKGVLWNHRPSASRSRLRHAIRGRRKESPSP